MVQLPALLRSPSPIPAPTPLSPEKNRVDRERFRSCLLIMIDVSSATTLEGGMATCLLDWSSVAVTFLQVSRGIFNATGSYLLGCRNVSSHFLTIWMGVSPG